MEKETPQLCTGFPQFSALCKKHYRMFRIEFLQWLEPMEIAKLALMNKATKHFVDPNSEKDQKHELHLQAILATQALSIENQGKVPNE